MRPGAVGISLVGTRRPGRQRNRPAAAPVSRTQPQNRAISIVACALGQGRLRETPPSPGLALSLQSRCEGRRVTPDEGLACARRHPPSDEIFHPAGVRTRGGRRQDPRPDSKPRPTNSTTALSIQLVTAHTSLLPLTFDLRSARESRKLSFPD